MNPEDEKILFDSILTLILSNRNINIELLPDDIEEEIYRFLFKLIKGTTDKSKCCCFQNARS